MTTTEKLKFAGLSMTDVRNTISKPEQQFVPADGLYAASSGKEQAMSEQSTSAPVVYKDILNFTGYRVGTDGSVWTIKAKGGNDRSPGREAQAWKRMRTHRDRKGYCRVNLIRDGVNHSRLVHQLVLEAFVGPCPEGMEACHYPDHDKTNNNVTNLRWDTHGENAKDAYRDHPPLTEKQCRRCLTAKPVAEFYKDSRSSDGFKTECKSCHCKTSIATRDPEKRRKANREYMRRRRANG